MTKKDNTPSHKQTDREVIEFAHRFNAYEHFKRDRLSEILRDESIIDGKLLKAKLFMMAREIKWFDWGLPPHKLSAMRAIISTLNNTSHDASMLKQIDRAKGSLIGLAAGDALGTTVEFKSRDSFPRHDRMTGGGAFNVKAGEWTDDTAMALCLAQSLISQRAVDPHDQLRRYVRWMNEGYMACQGQCIDIGNATRDALLRYQVAPEQFAGSRDTKSSGNGGIMRIAPVVIASGSEEAAIAGAIDSSCTTHASDDCIDAARLMAQILWRLLCGAELSFLLEHLPVMLPRGSAISPILNGDFKVKSRSDIKSTGYVIDTLEAALWCCYQHGNYRESVIEAANLGDDADTVAAVTGQIAGAAYGIGSIPSDWSGALAWKEDIEAMAVSLSKLNISVSESMALRQI